MDKFIVSQLTARRYYAPARILYANGLLDCLITDAYYSPQHLPVFKILDKTLPKHIVKTYKRYSSDIPFEKVSYDWQIGLKFRYNLQRADKTGLYKAHLSAYKALAKKAIDYANNNKDVLSFYGYDTASWEFFKWAHPKKWKLVLDQCVAPRSAQIKMHEVFAEKYGVDEQSQIEHCKRLQEREENEWQMASTILAPSEYVKTELVSAGAPIEKIKLTQFGFTPSHTKENVAHCIEKRFKNQSKKTQILFAGNVGYRKGIYDFLAVAEELQDQNINFVIAGKIEKHCEEYLKSIKHQNVTFLGKLPISELHKEYQKSDIFFFPSYLEGSAMVVFEAMSWGLPIVTTFETGSIVRQGVDGFLCNAGETERMKSHIMNLINDDNLRYKMSNNALTNLTENTVEHYSSRLIEAIQQ